MIINCGRRRLCSYKYGWKIEIRRTHRETGKARWEEDRPAYPANLAHALENILERTLKDEGEIAVDELPARLKAGYKAVRGYMAKAREAV